MSSNISFTGLASGLNTTALIQNVLRFSQQRITQLQSTVTTDQTQQSAFQGIQSDIQAFQTAASQLSPSVGSVFDSVTATSSNSGVLTAAAGSGAQPGITSLQVLSLAQTNQIASQGFSDPSSVISQGTFQISSGSKSSTITIDSTNNTVSGLAAAINNAGIGVSASVINTGSGAAKTQPYRLLLTSTATGTANAIQITNNLAASSGAAVQPNFSSSVIGPAATSSGFSGTSSITSSGTYTASANDQFTFNVLNGGTVGTDNGIQIGYTNSSGTKTGTLTVNPSDLGNPLAVADGVQVSFGAGTLSKGDKFTVNTFTPTIQEASNAKVQIGSGSGAIVVQNSTNTLTDLIPGVTLSLQSAAPGQTIQVNVTHDVAAVTTAITNFVNDYNTFASDLDAATKFTPGQGTSPGTAGPLNGYSSLNDIHTQLEQQILAVAPNLPSELNRLGALGITIDGTGQLSLNKTQLQSVLTGGVSGVGFNDVKNLFSLQGQSSSPSVQFSFATDKTKPSTTPYTVHITQAAAQASVTGTNQTAASTIIDSSNNSFSFTLDGHDSGTIKLASGTYTQDALAKEIQTEINSSVQSNGSGVTVTISNNSLTITSNRFGSASTITNLSGNALSALGFSGSESSTGKDVQGSYIVNGLTETATGTGQVLAGDASNANTSGLQVVVSLNSSQVPADGIDSSLTVTQGVASILNNNLKNLLDPVSGQLQTIGKQISKTITDAQADVTKEQNAYSAQQATLQLQFAALETVLANLQQTSNLLTSQLANSSSSSSSSSKPAASSAATSFANASIASNSTSG